MSSSAATSSSLTILSYSTFPTTIFVPSARFPDAAMDSRGLGSVPSLRKISEAAETRKGAT